MPTGNFTYFVSGKIYARLAGAAAGFEWPGLVDSVQISFSENVISLQDRTTPGGGVYQQIRRIESMSIVINHREINKTTLARALYGESSDVNAGTVSNEEHDAYKGAFIPLNHPGPYTGLGVSTDDTASVAISTANYEVVPGGIRILDDAPNIVDGDTIQITYTHPAYSRVQALTGSAPELEIHFAGQNEARDNKEVNVRLHKVRLGPVQDLQLLSGDDFGALQLTGEVLKDTTITGDGISQYFFEDIVP
jgi:hypothetical protein